MAYCPAAGKTSLILSPYMYEWNIAERNDKQQSIKLAWGRKIFMSVYGLMSK